MIEPWSGTALNQDPESPNEIHGDELAQQYGFKGGLVPGVTVSAYLLHPAVVAWGMDFLSRGSAHVRVSSPLYDGDRFSVAIVSRDGTSYQAQLSGSDGNPCASAQAALPRDLPEPPQRRGDRIAPPDHVGPVASREVLEQLMQRGCVAQRYHWGPPHLMRYYLRDEAQMPPLLAGEHAYANMSFILGISNFMAASNVTMNPWVHLETRSQNFRPLPHDTHIVAEMRVTDLFEKRGHEFFDAEVNLFDEADDSCLTAIELRAIYRLRRAGSSA
ncbi:MAG: hypothetical protein R3228_13595 [Halioglobus sp.]|nr:hypothetical protein [Halioglobus sp.]